ncbi:MAG: site-2 protease family protein [Phycisphaerales bacterium]
MLELSTAANLLLVIIGFGSLILVHELGHFLAAKWAKVRVHDFAIGFGPAIVSYRKGISVRMGSTIGEYERRMREAGKHPMRDHLEGVSDTEYRLNWFPLGGYVRMLGQDDSNPAAISNAPDSFTSQKVWKRMVIISAGVVMNILVAAALFIAVFMHGRIAPAPIVGEVASGSPAALAQPIDASASLAGAPGLRPGDEVVSIDGKPAHTFADLQIAAATAVPGEPRRFTIRREGVDGTLTFVLRPEKSTTGPGVQIGVAPGLSGTVAEFLPGDEDLARAEMVRAGLEGVWSGMTIVEAGGAPASTWRDLDRAVAASGGAPVTVVFETPAGERIERTVQPRPELQTAGAIVPQSKSPMRAPHLAGLMPPMLVQRVTRPAALEVMRPGDVLVRVESLEWPDLPGALRTLYGVRSGEASLAILRDAERFETTLGVSDQGMLGVELDSTGAPAVVTRIAPATDASGEERDPWPGASLDLPPGTRIEAVDGQAIATFADLRDALRRATADALAADSGASVVLTVRLPLAGGTDTETVALTLAHDDVRALHDLGWINPVDPLFFRPVTTLQKAEGPIAALGMGVHETNRIIRLTYLTLLRFFQGSVEIEQFSGPVGIAHVGTRIAQDGFISLLFFLAVISANLAVINFLPLPIVDGGHMVYLTIEGITGKPVSVAVQNIAALLGLCVIAGFFLVVTFNDIKNLLGA